jgi:uncharacterized cofD-like protein
MTNSSEADKKIVVIGGGTGSFVMLSALKKHAKHLTAIVNMADDGGSTGVLRDELGTLPSGDVRQCLVALSDSPKLRELFNYRFEEGTFGGHSFGNLFLTALEKTTGSFAEAVQMASKVLRIRGTVIPATLDDVRLKMEWPDASVILHGERVIDVEHFIHDPRKAELSLTPKPVVNPAAIQAIEEADLVVVSAGDLYTSLGPLLVIDGIGKALHDTKATVVYVCNLVTKHGQTDGFTVSDHAAEIERFGDHDGFLDVVLYNQQVPDAALLERYKEEDSTMVAVDENKLRDAPYRAIGANLLGQVTVQAENETIKVPRTFIRHNADEVAKQLMKVLEP